MLHLYVHAIWSSYSFYSRVGDGTKTESISALTKIDQSGILNGKTIVKVAGGSLKNWFVNCLISDSLNYFILLSCLSTDYWHSLALDSNGQAYSWGYNNVGQFDIVFSKFCSHAKIVTCATHTHAKQVGWWNNNTKKHTSRSFNIWCVEWKNNNSDFCRFVTQ